MFPLYFSCRVKYAKVEIIGGTVVPSSSPGISIVSDNIISSPPTLSVYKTPVEAPPPLISWHFRELPDELAKGKFFPARRRLRGFCREKKRS